MAQHKALFPARAALQTYTILYCLLIVALHREPPRFLEYKSVQKPPAMAQNNIQYSEKYYDDIYEYRHVVLPQEIAQLLPKGRLLSENEWRALGVQQSRGWVHYAIHRPEPHIMLFRRPKGYGQGPVAPDVLQVQ